ncbi:MAG: FAD:protein FMN transferase [Candidatus Eisenbacteria bacterium]|nr:FAD:protein FMN transferase [Candidatus Eisenbacteria bacterium]
MRDPHDRVPYFARLRLDPGECISTSGKYEQFVAQDGRTYGHIMDPRKGRPAEGLISVTVISRSAFLCDAWDTPFFVLGGYKARRRPRPTPISPPCSWSPEPTAWTRCGSSRASPIASRSSRECRSDSESWCSDPAARFPIRTFLKDSGPARLRRRPAVRVRRRVRPLPPPEGPSMLRTTSRGWLRASLALTAAAVSLSGCVSPSAPPAPPGGGTRIVLSYALLHGASRRW